MYDPTLFPPSSPSRGTVTVGILPITSDREKVSLEWLFSFLDILVPLHPFSPPEDFPPHGQSRQS